MHLMMILAALGLAWSLRLAYKGSIGSWSDRSSVTLLLFLFSPLLLVTTALAVLCMGPQGKMLGLQASWFSYLLSLGFLASSGVQGFKLVSEGWRSVRQVNTCPLLNLGEQSSRILDTNILFCAQIGFWQPQLVVSQGMLMALDGPHLEAVIAHEQAHYYYRDTFWFFWLGWVRSCTAWLPNTEILWQELLALRELRADRWATQHVDPLLLAESLLQVVSATTSSTISASFCAAFSSINQRNRLGERIDALITPTESTQQSNWCWAWLLLVCLPLVALPFHS